MKKENYILGLDIGISSVGWGLLALDENGQPYRIIDVGSRIFTPGEVEKTGDSRAKERREKRGARRIIRRRAYRIDRIRNLLYEYGYLKGIVNSNILSVRNEELTKIYEEMINNYYTKNHVNPYILKVEALDRKLTDDELCIILVHYAKKRGYKSNREEESDKESGKVLSAIAENKKILKDKNYRTISEMYVKDDKFKKRIRNAPDDYKVSVEYEMYLDEINNVLDKQIKYGLITEEFKEKYLEIYSSRRHYSKGPGNYYIYDKDGNKIEKLSPYGGDLIEKMTGKCKFDDKPRAPKMAPSTEIFVSLTKLLNLRYHFGNEENYYSLNSDEINTILNNALEKNTITYSDIIKLINKDNVGIKGLDLSRNDFIKVIKEFKTKYKIPNDEKVDINGLSPDEKEEYDKLRKKALQNKVLIELKGYHALRKAIEKGFGSKYFDDIKTNFNLLDDLAILCTNYKQNEDIKRHMSEYKEIPSDFTDDNFIKTLPNFKDHNMLSLDIIRDLIPLMKEGNGYDKAMEKLGYTSFDLTSNKEKSDLLVPIYVDDSITNQRVIRSLTQTRKVINAIIKKYGMPKCINIETARELAKSRKERREIEKNQNDRREENDKIKKELVGKGFFNEVEKINSNDLLKYKLWKEQKEFCAYSLKKITLDDLFTNNTVQIDHILPYSRTFNDNYLNKTLVLTKENQDKGNRTPYEWFGKTDKWQEYENYINSLNIPTKKKENYLLKELNFDMEREMRDQNLNDTKYISRELSSLIKAYLNVDKVNMYQGQITSKLRARWGFNRLTHSFISPRDYYMPKDMKEDVNKDRDNHLHHAMDALVIASITPSLQQKITLYEKFSRYIDGMVKEKLEKMDKIIEDDKVIYYDDKGEVIDEVSYREYLKEEVSKNHIYYSEHNVATLKFPLPYEIFKEEAKIRVYERDAEVLKSKLNNLGNYTKEELDKVNVLMPSFAKPKLSGAMHEETYYGLHRNTENEIDYKTIRKRLENISKKDLENMPDRLGGSKDIYNAIINWFGDCEKGSDALKMHNGKYPVNPNDKEQKEIKKIKIYLPYNEGGHIVNGASVEKGSIYRIDVLKSKDTSDDKLYFAGYDLLEIKKINSINKENQNSDFKVKIEYGQKKYINSSYIEMLKGYDVINTLLKNDLIEVTTKGEKKVTAYVLGYTNGKLAVKSIIGDSYDIVQDNGIFQNFITKYEITVSQIKEIKKLSINILGEISGLQTSNN